MLPPITAPPAAGAVSVARDSKPGDSNGCAGADVEMGARIGTEPGVVVVFVVVVDMMQ